MCCIQANGRPTRAVRPVYPKPRERGMGSEGKDAADSMSVKGKRRPTRAVRPVYPKPRERGMGSEGKDTGELLRLRLAMTFPEL